VDDRAGGGVPGEPQAALAALNDDLLLDTADLGLDENGGSRSVVVPEVVGDLLAVQTYFPVLASTATTEFVYGLAPGRFSPKKSGAGLPTAKYIRPVSGSMVTGIHTPPPPW